MSFLSKRSGNTALIQNGYYTTGQQADIAINTHGSDWYFTVCAIMVVATFGFLGLGTMKPRSQRVFHYITAGITMVASIAYFSMGSNLGWSAINVEFHRSSPHVAGQTREIFWVRYIDWFITTPLLLLDLLLTAALPWPTTSFVILTDWVMVVTGLIGALVASSYKWGYFTFGCVALGYIVYVLSWEARINANRLGKDVGRAFLICGSLTSFLWILYPIAWGLCEGGNVIGSDGEAIFYGILDILAKPVFGALLIWGHRGIDPARLGLTIHDYSDNDLAVNEKKHHNGATNGGVANGATNGTVADDAAATV